MRRGALRFLWGIGVVGLWLAGCGGDEDKCTPGSEGCACTQGNLCLSGLSCFSNVCVQGPGPQTTNPSDPTNPPTTADGSSSSATTDPPDPTTGGAVPECPQGQTQCGDDCVDLSGDAAHCGDCDNVCPMGQVCQDSKCLAVENCTPMSCPGLSYCTLDTKQCVPGCQFTAQCAEHESCDTIAHECVCVAGYHRKNGVCVPCDEAGACGEQCEVCPTVENGSPACIGGLYCGATCSTGYQECDGECIVDYPPICDAGRNTCTPCTEPDGGTVECKGEPSVCSKVCPQGTEACAWNACRKAEGFVCKEDDECCGKCQFDVVKNYSTCT